MDSLPLDSLPLETLIWQVSQHLHPHRAAPHLWVGMILEAKGDLSAAATAYSRSRVVAMPYDWQPTFRLWRVARRLGDAEVARECRDALVRLWGARTHREWREHAYRVTMCVANTNRARRCTEANGLCVLPW